jgi:hypothetical protein
VTSSSKLASRIHLPASVVDSEDSQVLKVFKINLGKEVEDAKRASVIYSKNLRSFSVVNKEADLEDSREVDSVIKGVKIS